MVLLRHRGRRGLALLIVVGILGILAVLAAAFVTMAQLERRASRQRLNATKALLLARSGIEDALARLSSGQTASYSGEDWDLSGTLNGEEVPAEVFRPGTLDRETCPARHALRPSFHVRDGLGFPILKMVDGRARGYSGGMREGRYALKVEDESAKININGGFLDAEDRDQDGVRDHRDGDVRETRYGPAGDPKDTGRGWNAQLVRILNILGGQSEIGIPTLGTFLVTSRPLGGWKEVPGPVLFAAAGLPPADVSPYLTVSSWVDAKVVHPNGYPGETLPTPVISGSSSPSYKHWLGFYSRYCALKNGRYPLALEEGGRSPVNLNGAPRPVLIALIQDLQGTAWGSFGWETGAVTEPPKTYTVTAPTAVRIAVNLIAFRKGQDPNGTFAAAGLVPGPFQSWDQFAAFVDALVPSVIKGFGGSTVHYQGGNLCAADLIKANFDPNTRLQKDRPDQVLWRWVDKSDLKAWSTEGNLGPTGTFKVSAVGRLAGSDGRLLAECTASLVTEVFSLARQTTQRDFVDGRTLAGPPTGYLSLSTATLYQTTGTKDPQSPPGWHTWVSPAGLAVITYPCPPMALPTKAAEFDGSVGLATTQLPGEDPSGGTLRFLHHFDGGWDAARAPTAAQKVHLLNSGPLDLESRDRQDDPSESVWPSSPGLKSNTLLPDGMHAEPYRSVDFQPQGFFPMVIKGGVPTNQGVFLYWVKDGHGVLYHTLAAFSRTVVTNAQTHSVNVGQYFDMGKQVWGVHAENWARLGDDYLIPPDNERVCSWFERDPSNTGSGKRRFPVSRWHLVLAGFDTGATMGNDVEAAVWGLPTAGGTAGPLNTLTFYSRYAPNSFNQAANEDLHKTEGDQYFTLGHQACVVDEFAIYDFGVDDAVDGDAMGWASQRFGDGRYYKEGDGVFLSGVLAPAAGAPVRLLSAQWTVHLPTERRLESLQTEAVSTDTSAVPRGRDTTLRYPDGSSRLWVDLDLLPATGDQAGPALQSLAQGGRIDRLLPGFRYRVKFKTVLNNPISDPVLESPWFDDITFAWQRMTGPRVLGWERDSRQPGKG
jgi:hypothetical protein